MPLTQPTEYAAGLKVAIEIAEWRLRSAQHLLTGQNAKIFNGAIEDVLIFLRGAESRASRGEDYRMLSTIQEVSNDNKTST